MKEVEKYINDLNHYEHQIIESLTLSKDEICSVVKHFKTDPEGFSKILQKNNVEQSYCSAINALTAIYEIYALMPSKPYPENIPFKIAAQISQLSLAAGCFAGLFPTGRQVEISEPKAKKGQKFSEPKPYGPTKKAMIHVYKKCIESGNLAALKRNSFYQSPNSVSFLGVFEELIKNDPYVQELILSISDNHIIPRKGAKTGFKRALSILSEIRKEYPLK